MSNSLAAVHPELIVEWSDRNLPLTPDSVTFGSNKKVWWKGACGHEWETSIKARSSGEKCPICSGARVIEGINDLSTLKPGLAPEWSEKNEIKPTEVSIGSHKKVIWKCKLGHEWIATVKSRTINKTGCPYCSHNKVLAGFNDLATLFPEVADEWSDKNEKKPTEVMAFANSKAWWKCKTCGYEWNTLISTRSGGSKCPCCSGYTFIKGKNDLKSTHPRIAKEWSSKNYPLQPDEVNAKSRKNVWWHCRKCGNEWKSVINARVKGTVCPVCAEREVLAGYNDLATTDKQLLTEWDYELNKLKPTEVSRNSAKRAWWQCRYGHS
jgi:DNA-directed RNA polymerase subunit RPC12/RpoP